MKPDLPLSRRQWAKNPWPARVLLLLQKLPTPYASRLWGTLLGIDCSSKLPRSIIFPHPYGIVIHSDTPIGRDCVIYQGVTIGSDKDGAFPSIGDGVVIYAGACLIGGIKVGSGAQIGANSVVLIDVPDGRTAAGVPSRILSKGEQGD